MNSPVSVLLTGETGTGKEYFAKALHQASERRSRPFVAVNCAAIPETLIESELFGHLPGSFTGAGSKGKRGLIQEADGGTLFLDEIGDMPRDLQARLLRVLAEREVLPIGATRPVPVNIRVIAATHCDLEALVREGRFRDDLYYRLNGAHFDAAAAARAARPGVADATHAGRAGGASATARVSCRRKPRERAARVPLAGQPARAAQRHRIRARGVQRRPHRHRRPAGFVEPAAIGAWRGGRLRRRTSCRRRRIDPLSADAALLMQYLRAAQWNVSAVARQLGISRMTLYRRMKRHGIESPNHQPADG